MSILITNARMVSEGQVAEGDQVVPNHRIAYQKGEAQDQVRGQRLEFGQQR